MVAAAWEAASSRLQSASLDHTVRINEKGERVAAMSADEQAVKAKGKKRPAAGLQPEEDGDDEDFLADLFFAPVDGHGSGRVSSRGGGRGSGGGGGAKGRGRGNAAPKVRGGHLPGSGKGSGSAVPQAQGVSLGEELFGPDSGAIIPAVAAGVAAPAGPALASGGRGWQFNAGRSRKKQQAEEIFLKAQNLIDLYENDELVLHNVTPKIVQAQLGRIGSWLKHTSSMQYLKEESGCMSEEGIQLQSRMTQYQV